MYHRGGSWGIIHVCENVCINVWASRAPAAQIVVLAEIGVFLVCAFVAVCLLSVGYHEITYVISSCSVITSRSKWQVTS